MEQFITSFENLITGLFAGMSGLAIGMISVFACLLGLLIIYFFRIHIAYRMAKNRHRNVGLWVLLSLIASPLLIIVILLIVGEDYSRR